MELAKNVQPVEGNRNPHVFELKTTPIIFYTGEDPSWGGKEATIVNSVESGIGLEQALCWESAIRQALMPVTPQASSEPSAKGQCLTPGTHKLQWSPTFLGPAAARSYRHSLVM